MSRHRHSPDGRIYRGHHIVATPAGWAWYPDWGRLPRPSPHAPPAWGGSGIEDTRAEALGRVDVWWEQLEAEQAEVAADAAADELNRGRLPSRDEIEANRDDWERHLAREGS